MKKLFSVCLVSLQFACNSANFGGNSGKKGDPVGNANSSPGSGASSHASDGSGESPDGVGQDGSSTDFNSTTGLNKLCLNKKAKEYNLAVVIDASLSERRTDPNNLRGTAAIEFANAMADYAKGQKGTSINMSMIGFSDRANIGNHGAVNVGNDGTDGLTEDVNTIIQTLGTGTNYDAALSAAEQSLQQMGAQKGQKSQRNFVVFLTDGEPNRADTGSIIDSFNPTTIINNVNSKIDSLVDTLDVAMITIASGSDINQKGLEIIENMAQPTTGTTYPDHKGKYIRTSSPDELGALAKQLGRAVSGCN